MGPGRATAFCLKVAVGAWLVWAWLGVSSLAKAGPESLDRSSIAKNVASHVQAPIADHRTINKRLDRERSLNKAVSLASEVAAHLTERKTLSKKTVSRVTQSAADLDDDAKRSSSKAILRVSESTARVRDSRDVDNTAAATSRRVQAEISTVVDDVARTLERSVDSAKRVVDRGDSVPSVAEVLDSLDRSAHEALASVDRINGEEEPTTGTLINELTGSAAIRDAALDGTTNLSRIAGGVRAMLRTTTRHAAGGDVISTRPPVTELMPSLDIALPRVEPQSRIGSLGMTAREKATQHGIGNSPETSRPRFDQRNEQIFVATTTISSEAAGSSTVAMSSDDLARSGPRSPETPPAPFVGPHAGSTFLVSLSILALLLAVFQLFAPRVRQSFGLERRAVWPLALVALVERPG